MWDLCFSGKPATSRNLAPARAPAANQAIRFGKTGVRIHLCRIRGGSGCRGPTNAAGAIAGSCSDTGGVMHDFLQAPEAPSSPWIDWAPHPRVLPASTRPGSSRENISTQARRRTASYSSRIGKPARTSRSVCLVRETFKEVRIIKLRPCAITAKAGIDSSDRPRPAPG